MMDIITNTYFISQIMGVMFIIVGISLMLNRGFFVKIVDDFEKNTMLLFFSGIITSILGLMIVFNVSSFENLHLGIVSFIGWAMTIKGAMFLMFPKAMINLGKNMIFLMKYSPIFGILYIIIGMYILYSINFMGWFM